MQEKDLRVVEKFKLLVSQKVKVLELRVFGSRARGAATEESDLKAVNYHGGYGKWELVECRDPRTVDNLLNGLFR